jgi:predicted DCC family thiol-disulfide oxidoreductase YuxK
VPLVLYTRPGCHLCDEMKAEIARADLGRPYELREVNIDTDPALAARFGLSIPVLEIAGRVAFKARLERAELERKFARLTESEV